MNPKNFKINSVVTGNNKITCHLEVMRGFKDIVFFVEYLQMCDNQQINKKYPEFLIKTRIGKDDRWKVLFIDIYNYQDPFKDARIMDRMKNLVNDLDELLTRALAEYTA